MKSQFFITDRMLGTLLLLVSGLLGSRVIDYVGAVVYVVSGNVSMIVLASLAIMIVVGLLALVVGSLLIYSSIFEENDV